MSPTMYRCCMFVTLVASALGAELTPIFTGSSLPEDTSPWPTNSPSQAPTQGIADFCFFSKYPSVSCRFKCHLGNMQPYCDNDVCLCKKWQDVEFHSLLDFPFKSTASDISHILDHYESSTSTPPSVKHPQNETQDGSFGNVIFLFDLSRLFDFDNTSSTTNAPEVVTPYSTKLTPWAVSARWSFQHLMALLIIFLLCILIVLELWFCFRRRNSKHNMDSLFRSMTVTDKA